MEQRMPGGLRGRIGPFPAWAVVVVAVALVAAGVAVAVAGVGGDDQDASGGPTPTGRAGLQNAQSGPAASGGDCAATLVAKLPLDQQAGQLLMIGTPIGSPLNATQTIQRYHLGGI